MTIQDWLGINNQIGIDIWNKKYKFENETFNEWIDRVSGNNENIKELILNKKFLFGGRILSNRGLQNRGKKITFSNCYVLSPPKDNIESIFDCAKSLARTFSYGGGCGIDISKLAPKGAIVNNAAKATTGSVSFMDLYSLVTELIGQSGRRGALMISIDCNHPDLEDFIDIKSDLNKVTKANISIKITEEFMEAVKLDSDYELCYIRQETGEKISKIVNAKEIFKKLSKMNWDYAEPGILFWDKINNWNLLSNNDEFEYVGVNPCAEEPLPAGGSCLLGSINLNSFIYNNKFDFEDFKKSVIIAVEGLNEVLDEGLPLHPLQEQKNSVADWRQIGLGIFGLADMLINLKIKYGSKESLELCDKIAFEMINSAIYASSIESKKYGSYPKYNKKEILSNEFFIKNTTKETKEFVEHNGLRNSQLLTCAPTGTLSTMFGISGGIEPIYEFSYNRKTESLHGEDIYYKIFTPIVEDYMKQNNIEDDCNLPDYFVNAMNLNYRDRIAMQSIWQQHIDASISSTINVPNQFKKEDIFNLYVEAYDKGLKGCTIYRNDCKRSGILTIDKKESDNKLEKLERGYIIEVDDELIGCKRKLQTGCGSLHCQAFFDPINGDLMETFFSKGSSGGCNNFMVSLSRMISYAARIGADIDNIIDQLNSCGTCPSYAVRSATKKDVSKGSCCPIAIGYALKDMHNQVLNDLGLLEEHENEIIDCDKELCPECKMPLLFEGGCCSCKNCGYSRCD